MTFTELEQDLLMLLDIELQKDNRPDIEDTLTDEELSEFVTGFDTENLAEDDFDNALKKIKEIQDMKRLKENELQAEFQFYEDRITNKCNQSIEPEDKPYDDALRR